MYAITIIKNGVIDKVFVFKNEIDANEMFEDFVQNAKKHNFNILENYDDMIEYRDSYGVEYIVEITSDVEMK